MWNSVVEHAGRKPQIDPSVFLAQGSQVIGEVTLGEQVSIWNGAILRGDVNFIKIGARTNVQDLSMIHVSYRKNSTVVGEDCTIGHHVVLHGCTVGDRVLVGMGAIVMDGVVIGDDCLIAAGALITENTVIPAGSLVMGSPAKVKRTLKDEEFAFLKKSAVHYIKLAESYVNKVWPVDTGFRP